MRTSGVGTTAESPCAVSSTLTGTKAEAPGKAEDAHLIPAPVATAPVAFAPVAFAPVAITGGAVAAAAADVLLSS